MGAADHARHKIATHKRAQLSFDTIATGARYIAIHEDAIGMLRPTVEISRGLEQVAAVAANAREVAICQGNGTLDHFFYQMDNLSHDLVEKLHNFADTSSALATIDAGHPELVDSRLFASMQFMKVFPPGDAVRIVKAAVSGDLAELVVRVDRILTRPADKTAKPVTSVRRSIIGVWNTPIPSHAATWFADATCDPGEIVAITGGTVRNATPAGRLELHHPILQIPVDVKQSTAPSVVCKILAGVLAKFPDAGRIGVICHRCHVATVRGTGHGSTITEAMASRIAKVEHFRSGESRGSNDWFESCDLLVVLGTPRVPPSAVKSRLIQTGRVLASTRDGQWEPDYWSGVTTAGKRVTVRTLAYRDHDWHFAHRAIVRSELIQSVGRGRGLLETGIPVVVLSNECLEFPILDVTEFEPLPENQILALKAIFELSGDSRLEKSCHSQETGYDNQTLNSITLEFCCHSSVLTSLIALKLKKTRQAVLGILKGLCRRGLIEKIGQRGGWKITAGGIKLLFPPDPVPETEGAEGNAEIAAIEIDLFEGVI